MWHYNKTIRYIYVAHTSQAVWVYFDGISGWKRIRTGAADGVTNLCVLLSAAKANSRKVHVRLDGSWITTAYLV